MMRSECGTEWLCAPLQQAPLGENVRVVRVDHEDPIRLVRLANLGLLPGTTVHVRQRWPALIVGIGESVLALDGELGSTIHVQHLPSEASACAKRR